MKGRYWKLVFIYIIVIAALIPVSLLIINATGRGNHNTHNGEFPIRIIAHNFYGQKVALKINEEQIFDKRLHVTEPTTAFVFAKDWSVGVDNTVTLTIDGVEHKLTFEGNRKNKYLSISSISPYIEINELGPLLD